MIAPVSNAANPPDTPSRFNSEALEHLRTALKGQALLPGDAGFDEAILAWSRGIRHAPSIVVLPETAADVVAAVAFARDHDLPVAVQSTGHGVPVGCIDGMLINTMHMQGVTVDPATRIARVEAGAKWGSVVPVAQEHGLAPLSGSSTDVGVVGYTLGGGHGWLARKYGRAADRVVAADLVTAEGELLHVTEERHPDLFWAIRRGTSNFGIVTALEFELVPVAQVFGGSVMYPLMDASAVFAAFAGWVADLTDDVTASISIMRFPPLPELPPMLQGVACVVVRACAVDDLAAGEAAIAPMRSLGQPIIDTFGIMPFSAIDAISMDPVDPMPAIGRTLMLPSLDDAVIGALLAETGPGVESPILMTEIRYFGEAEAPFSLYAVGVTFSPEMHAAVSEALMGLGQALQPFAADRVMLNFLADGDVGDHRTRAAYSEADYLRLQRIKGAYDPGNRFRFNHNIPPAIVEA